MSAIDDVVQANARYAHGFRGPKTGEPGRRLAVLTCMDARLDPLAAFGLHLGDAHILRNAGGLPTDDALRSLAISQRALNTTEIAVVHHTRCGMADFDDDRFRADLAQESGETPSWRVPGFSDVEADTRRSVEVLRNCPWLPHRNAVRGFVYDVDAGTLTEVE
ncbi:beta-class carbonic anhydrase [uncultured Jatrophihabitans sp.]|uniref:beta-class carbonic anhydrase n=1 Tax=uncultured Jatrophihabitans sp. TaxID=1610747 RepID=UPI0035C971F5